MKDKPLRFISERVEPLFADEKGFEKRPLCLRGFVWHGQTYQIDECLSEWRDYARRGKMAHNMRPSHLVSAEKRGSRGVGRHYFRVRTNDGRVFDLYYDRAPRDTADRKGSWHLFREMEPGAGPGGGARAAGGEERP
ncbi:MAG: DUF6504 family protein [Candidatus Eisenbacteria bacterium]